MKNKPVDLNNILFCQLERLNDEELKGDDLREEIERSKAISSVAVQVIDNARLVIQAAKMADELGIVKPPEFLGIVYEDDK